MLGEDGGRLVQPDVSLASNGVNPKMVWRACLLSIAAVSLPLHPSPSSTLAAALVAEVDSGSRGFRAFSSASPQCLGAVVSGGRSTAEVNAVV